MPQNCVLASVIAPGKNFLPVCSKITLVFTSFYSKQRFYLCSAKWRWFRILFLRTIFTSVFVTKLHFWCSLLLEKFFGLLATKLDYLWAVYHIKPAFACWQEMHCFEFYITKKSVFAFSSLKHAGLSFIAQKACFGLFAIILVCFRCYCTKKRFSSSMQGVTLIFTWFYSNNGFPSFTLSQNRLSEDKLVLCFHNQTTLWTLYITEKMFWFVGNWIRLS